MCIFESVIKTSELFTAKCVHDKACQCLWMHMCVYVCVCVTELLVAKNQINIKFHQAEINLQLATRFLMWFVRVLMFKQVGLSPVVIITVSLREQQMRKDGNNFHFLHIHICQFYLQQN